MAGPDLTAEIWWDPTVEAVDEVAPGVAVAG